MKFDSQERFIAMLVNIGKKLPMSLLRFLAPNECLIPFYHTVSNENLLHVKHLYKYKSEIEFIQDLDFLARRYQFIDLPTFLKSKSCSSKKKYCLLTFDDGMREVKEVIAPILRKKGIPALFFLNSAFVDNHSLFFKHKASLLIELFYNSGNSLKNRFVKQLEDKVNTKDVNQLKVIPYSNKDDLDQLAEVLSFDEKEFLKKEKPYLNLDEIKELQNEGFDFGAHSVDHPYFSKLSINEQLHQYHKSVEWVEKSLQVDQVCFAFPFTDDGVTNAFFNRIRNNGLESFTFGTAGIKKDDQGSHFQRLAFEQGQLTAKEILKTELFSYILKVPLGKQWVRR